MSSDSPREECSSSPSSPTSTSSRSRSIVTTTIEELDPNNSCFLLRNAVDLDLQQAVFADIMDKSKRTDNNITKSLYPSP
eukprot:CAMPEP_0113505710 /NCGR_PEP_ID=MMETSP0014_2-20120614/35477_1 /TAXON_ID=2857 /ORGANISM="Nitzschia sp." /LENGTH=79 /DNA_ID=CAMNT_0000401071 /DNA_START=105 /DNA_END=341 /DNA_ORIENTATION=- /assembly_acc=CAM_ASM_000159